MMELLINQIGDVRFIYSEQLALQDLGKPSITRASHVEPNPDGTWSADLSPVDGPILGPFTLRSHALNAEVVWLRKHLIN